MTSSSRGSLNASRLLRSSRYNSICSECHSHIQRRSYAIAAESLKTLDSAPNSILPDVQKIPPVTSSGERQFIPKAGLVLSRPPLLTPPLTTFEKSYFFYQKRLNERLAMPFTKYFYFKKGSTADTDWKIKAKERNWVAQKEIGGYRAFGDEAWNDEILVKEKALVEPKYIIETLVKDSKVRAVEGKDGQAVEVEEGGEQAEKEGEGEVKVLGRRTGADWKNDMRRLDRKLERTLYLVVKGKKGWGFPMGGLEGRENLHQAAERILVQSAGLNMNTWIVGYVPIGYRTIEPKFNKKDGTMESIGEKVFFMKGRIMAGQADLKGNPFGLEDFKWLTREEIEKHFSDRYWSYVRNMLPER